MVIARADEPPPAQADQASTGSPPALGQARPSDIQTRLTEAEETLRAIRNGEVDALVVRGSSPAAQVFTLSSADRPYRMFVENMRDGAATVSDSGIILYANRRLADLLSCPLAQIIGSPITSFIASGDHAVLHAISGKVRGGTFEAGLAAAPGNLIPVRINASTLDVDGHGLMCLTFADLTEQNAHKREIERLSRAQTDRMRELELAQAALTEQATHDALTGLPNRSLIIDRLAQAVAVARRLHKSTGLIFVDLDHFKEINDTGGHEAGDAVLRQVAQRLLSAVRPMDSVSRLGGDEFVVLAPVLESPEGAVAVAKRITAALEAPIPLSHGSMTVTASIGVSVSHPADPEYEIDPDRLLRHADTAMYHAKSLGGSRIELFDSANTPTVFQADREMWIARIREALDEDGFVLEGQPIVELASGKIVERELLLRMRDPGGQLFPPLAFLPTAERCGLIYEIDRWVIKQAIKMAARGQSVSVNLSAPSVGDPRLLELIERDLRNHEADPSRLVFEITETAVMQNMDRAAFFAERLVALGCKLALDDFGTGFASFTYLKRLPVHYLKIDIDFVRDVARSTRDMFVVRAIVALAGDFGQQTIAEGVEDQATAKVLQDLGVTYSQGYLYGAPGPLPGKPDKPHFMTARPVGGTEQRSHAAATA